MKTDYTGRNTRQVGDINLASALMAVGIPLDHECPVKIIDGENLARPYASFRVCDYSPDGRHQTDACMGHWSGVQPLPCDHPFAVVAEFIAGRPSGKLTADDWLDYAIDYLQSHGVSLPGLRSIANISEFVATLPTAPESYVLAFVANRQTCLALYRNATRSVYMTRDDRHAVIDSTLPKWQRNELLSRLQG
jgi:hypothetical protein